MKKRVLLTGISGFLGSHTAIQLLNKGYEVIGTIRNLNRADDINKVISHHSSNTDNLIIVEANLLNENIWVKLTKDIDYVMHIASPFPRTLPKNDEELVIPAKQGTLNVLRAASKNGVKRIVITSSSTAVLYGKEKNKRDGIYTEEEWTDETNLKDTAPYIRSKTIAEKAAWEFIKTDNSGLELTTVCPGAILGPVLEKDFGTSANIVIKTMDGSSPAIPQIGFEIVDVRSVADLQIRAMEMKKAAGQRFNASVGFMKFKEIADILRVEYPDKKIPKKTLPNFMTRFISNFEKTLKPILIDLNVERKLDNSKAKKLLSWEPIPNRKAVLDCAESVINLGILK